MGAPRRRTGRPPHLDDDLGTGAGADQYNGVEAAHASGTAHAYRRMLGHPNPRTPQLPKNRDQREQQIRQAAGDKAYHRFLTDDAEHGLAHAPEARRSLNPASRDRARPPGS
ncbi:hypothetical protein [Streptomyces sp. NPDC056690]|uniref:hypothetical protein n=1 Tax=unclassified Streptomyces TaxID=2593676 RepID=UPI00363256E4